MRTIAAYPVSFSSSCPKRLRLHSSEVGSALGEDASTTPVPNVTGVVFVVVVVAVGVDEDTEASRDSCRLAAATTAAAAVVDVDDR